MQGLRFESRYHLRQIFKSRLRNEQWQVAPKAGGPGFESSRSIEKIKINRKRPRTVQLETRDCKTQKYIKINTKGWGQSYRAMIIIFYKKWAIPCLFLVYFSYFQTTYRSKTVDSSRIRTNIIRVEGKHADQLTTTATQDHKLLA